MNSVQVLGNLARDPVIRATKTGKQMAYFTVAVDREYTTPQGEKKQITDWVNVVAWGNMAEAVGNYLRKGYRCFVEGRFTTRSYDTPDGQRRWVSEVTAQFIGVPLTSQTAAVAAGNQQPASSTPYGQKAYSGPATGYNNVPQSQGQQANFSQFGPAGPDPENPQPMKQDTMFPEDGPHTDEDIPF